MTDKLKIHGNCIHPVRVYNRNTHDYILAPCLHCVACNNASASKQTVRVYNEIKQHRYSIYFTLTYDNDHLPRFEMFLDRKNIIQCRPVGRCVDSFDSYPLNFTDIFGSLYFEDDIFLPTIENDAPSYQFGVCCKKDIQDFVKRVRKKIDKLNIPENEKQIRYYIASEYGPKTYRPHYHGFFFFDNEEILSQIENIICYSWGLFRLSGQGFNDFVFEPFARIDFTRRYIQLCDPNTAYYVADYVSGNLDLPKVLQLRQTKPFHLSSKNPVVGCFHESKAEILENVYTGTYAPLRSFFDNKSGCTEYVNIPLSSDSCSSLFRKCFEYSTLTSGAKRDVYSFYMSHLSEWRDSVINNLIEYNYVQNSSYSLSDYLLAFPSMTYRRWCAFTYPDLYLSLHMDKDSSWYASRLCYLVCKNEDLHKYFPYTDVLDAYLWFLDKYYYLKSQYQLKQFYELQDEIIKRAGYQAAMLHSYPFMLEHVVKKQEKYKYDASSIYLGNNSKNLSHEENIFYFNVACFNSVSSFGVLDSQKLDNLAFEHTGYYKRYVASQRDKFTKRNKSKKINNTYISGVRKMS